MHPNSIEEIYADLIRLRQNPATKKKFPSETWDAIIQPFFWPKNVRNHHFLKT